MNTKICINNYGIALVSLETAKKISNDILSTLQSADKCTVDFQDVISITTQVANAIFSPIIRKIGNENFREKITLNFYGNSDLMFTVSEALEWENRKG